MATINFNVIAQVLEGPKVTVGAQNWVVEAYDRIDSTVPGTPAGAAAPSTATVQVAPGLSTNAVALLVVYADRYQPNPLTYKSDTAAAAAPAHTLDRPLVLWGASAVNMFEDQLKSIVFTNPDPADNPVHILVARDATP
jgi:hypothetical protein